MTIVANFVSNIKYGRILDLFSILNSQMLLKLLLDSRDNPSHIDPERAGQSDGKRTCWVIDQIKLTWNLIFINMPSFIDHKHKIIQFLVILVKHFKWNISSEPHPVRLPVHSIPNWVPERPHVFTLVKRSSRTEWSTSTNSAPSESKPGSCSPDQHKQLSGDPVCQALNWEIIPPVIFRVSRRAFQYSSLNVWSF